MLGRVIERMLVDALDHVLTEACRRRDRREMVAIRSQLIYSCRRAIIGSVREARRAGTRHANAATTMRMIETADAVEK